MIDFGEFCTLIRNDLMGISAQRIPIKKICKRYGIDDPTALEEGIEAMAYLILHMAKVKASEEEFKLIY